MSVFARTDRTVFGRWWWTVDRPVLGGIAFLAALGVLMVLSASPPVARNLDYDESYFIVRHLRTLVLAAACLVGVSLLAPRGVLRAAIICLAVFGAATVATLFLAPEIKGSHRWLFPLGQQLQPSEFVKPALAVVTGWVLARAEGLQGLPVAGTLIAIVTMVLLLQPDLGMAVLIGAVFCAQLFVAGLAWGWVAAAIAVACTSVWGAYHLLPHVKERIDGFLDPTVEVYQVERALSALTSGGLFGRGPGEGVVKYNLPEAHSDFVFATAAEEFGILFCLLIVTAFALIVLRALGRVYENEDRFVQLAGVGLITQLGLQALINMAVNLNLIPTKGMTLPLISYGGSSMVALGIGLGMLLALTRRGVKLEAAP
ncbi:MAG: cell division protein FtsW [Geminicoccaceae bacterium]|nr:cell division protein FtsW [Geminicoccaceae bacterium]